MSSNNPIGAKSNDLCDFMIAVTRDMSDEYERIQKRACEDPGTAGDQGEENWATLFRDWLPPSYPIRALADYFRLANLLGGGQGDLRRWEVNIYSDQVRESITEGENHIIEPWNEWAYELCKLWIVA
jgi:hypothetical protein